MIEELTKEGIKSLIEAKNYKTVTARVLVSEYIPPDKRHSNSFDRSSVRGQTVRIAKILSKLKDDGFLYVINEKRRSIVYGVNCNDNNFISQTYPELFF